MIPARVSMITLGAHDLEALREFYASFGWKELPASEPGWAAFDTGGAVLALYPLGALALEAGLPPPVARVSFRGVVCSINVESAAMVGTATDRARTAGARIVAEPHDTLAGGRAASFADPEGNAWEIAWIPGSWFDERGGLLLN